MYRRIRKISLMRVLSCDSVMDGAFFPQPDLHVPEKEVGELCGRGFTPATEEDVEREWGKFRVREQGGAPPSPAYLEPDRDYPSLEKNKDGHSHQRQRHASILHHQRTGSERAHEFHPEVGWALHDTHDRGPLFPPRARARRWRSAGRSVEFYHPSTTL